MGESLLLNGTGSAEIAVIGAMLMDDACVPAVLGVVSESDFSDGTCRATYRAIRELFLSGRAADPVTVVDAMQGGDTYRQWIAEVMMAVPTAANVTAYCDIVRDGGLLRRLRSRAETILTSLDLASAEQAARSMMDELTSTSRMPRMTGVELATDFVSRMRSQQRPDYLPWGLPTLDRSIQSELGDFNVLGGYPSSGKTLLSLQIALAMAKRYRVGYYSLETRPEKLADRLFSHLSGTALGAIKSCALTDGDWGRIAGAVSGFSEHCPFDVIRAAGSSVADLAADAVARKYQVIFVDYIQLLKVPGIKPGDRYAMVTVISSELHLFAQQHNVAVIALSQLSRPENSKAGKVPPGLHSLRESGQIEQDADSVILVYPSDANDNRSNRMIKIAKNKDGPRAVFEVSFDGATQTMAEIAQQNSVASHYSDIGRRVLAQHRRECQQMQMQEVEDNGDNPWEMAAYGG